MLRENNLSKLIACLYFALVLLIRNVKSNTEDRYNDQRDVYLYYYTVAVEGPRMNCSGSIIGPKHVLTSAHCVMDENYEIGIKPIKIMANALYSYYIAVGVGQEIEVAKVCVHKSFRPHPALKYDHADVAVLELREPIKVDQFSKQLDTVLLPSESDYENLRTANLSTYGEQDFSDREYKMLHYGYISILDKSNCKRAWPTVAKYIDYDKQFCGKVKPPAIGTCKGDAGAPLVTKTTKGNVIVGMLSISPDDCDESNSSGIYTRVGYYRNFIDHLKNGMTDENAKCQQLV